MAQGARNQDEVLGSAESFIRLWGDMGPRWGVPRTLTLTHALLFIEGRPLNTDEVMERLNISRGNASMTLRTLVEWGLATRTHNPSDRRDYFAADQDVWNLFTAVVRMRRRNEVEPLLATLQALAEPAGGQQDAREARCRAKLQEMLQFARAFDGLAERFLAMGPDALRAFGEMADR